MTKRVATFACALALTACSATTPITTPGDCLPGPTVTIEGGADAFGEVGTYASGPSCVELCDASAYPMCRLVTETSVQCLRGCK